MKLAAGLAQTAMANFLNLDNSGLLMLFWFTKTMTLSTKNINMTWRKRLT